MSGWTTVTIEANDENDADRLRERFDSESDEEYDGSRNGSGDRVEALIWGYGSATTLKILDDYSHLWNTAVVMECNDTTDSGNGKVLSSDGSEIEIIDNSMGAERARGHDAAEELRKHIDGRVYMR